MMPPEPEGEVDRQLEEIKLFVPADRYRAFQRCVWIQIHESGRTQLDVMQEVVDDFLCKHGC
jgi:hypothetical protein